MKITCSTMGSGRYDVVVEEGQRVPGEKVRAFLSWYPTWMMEVRLVRDRSPGERLEYLKVWELNQKDRDALMAFLAEVELEEESDEGLEVSADDR